MSLHVYTNTAGTKILCGLNNSDKRRINKIIIEHTTSFHFLLC